MGGCVRDVMCGRKPKDWDITTNALPQQIKALFARTIDTGIKHGTVTIMMNHVGYEVTTYRIDGQYLDGRHPDNVTFTAELVEDLKRRDFTINAMAYNEDMGLIDVFGGMQDLERGIIRCVGNAEERFTEDALRIMRAVRFAAQLGFSIEDGTRQAIAKLAERLCQISRERIQAELVKLVTSDHPELIRIAYQTGITSYVLPEFDIMMDTPQHSPYHQYNVGEHTIRVMQAVRPDPYLRLAALLHDIGKPAARTTDENGTDHFDGHEGLGSEMAKNILKELKFDNKTIDIVTRLVKYHDYPLRADEKLIRRSMNRIGKDLYPYFLELRWADLAGKSEYSIELNRPVLQETEQIYRYICEQEQCVSVKDLAISGKDLIALGVPRGTQIGRLLDELLLLVLDHPEYNQKEILLKEALERIIPPDHS